MEFEYKVTVIIPVYNVEQYLEACLDSLLAQTFPQEEMEVLMINDGSPDGSLKICNRYVAAHPNFKVISQENQGVSAARNNGIRNARGKYLMYLDGDDTLSPETVKNVTDFFDEHYDEVDVVSYPCLFCYEDGWKVPHARDGILKWTRVYDSEETLYVNLTTINAAVKNKGNENFLFDDTLSFHEDEAYLAAAVMSQRKFGYVCEAQYLYRKFGNGATDQIVNPYYIFESTMALYEQLFEKYQVDGKVSKYIQVLVLNDFGWKIRQDVIFPYHYPAEKFEVAMDRIKKLVDHIDDDLLLNHPGIDIYIKFFLLSLKNTEGLNTVCGVNSLALCRNAEALCVTNSVTVVITRLKITEDFVELGGFLKSPFFVFSEKPELYVEIATDEGEYKEKVQLLDSAHSYYKSKIRIAQFWRFQVRIFNKVKSIVGFCVALNGKRIQYKYYFMPEVTLQNELGRQVVCFRGTRCALNGTKLIIDQATHFEQVEAREEKTKWYWKHNRKFWLVRKLAALGKDRTGRIWLYYDSAGVGRDNGYYQFMHDIRQKDGVTRYYVTHDKEFAASENFRGIPQKRIILYGSKRHKFLYLWCEKVITAYVETYNYIPFDWKTYGSYRDIGEPEIIYLQHGVLHAHVPQKYSLDRLNIDREVVSTFYEIKNLTENYHFRREDLILSGMPRYDYIDAHKKGEKKILFAPSWRQYLISMQNGIWKPEYKKFENSDFFQAVHAFLQSEELAEMLETYDYTLDLKLHPIFHCYQDYFSSENPRIRIAPTNVDAAQYSIFISDCSSFSFDFVYRKCAVLYFFPDYDMFKAGLMSYRQLDIPLEEGFGPFAQTVEGALCELKKILQNEGKPEELYQQRMENFFLYYDNEQTERIYEALMQKKCPMREGEIFEDMLRDVPDLSAQ